MEYLVRSESLTGYCDLVEGLGGSADELLAKFGLNRDSVETEGSMFPYRSFVALLEESARSLNCPDFGIRIAQQQDFSVLGPIALAAQQSTLVADALARVSSYLHVYTPALDLNANVLPDNKTLVLSIDIQLSPLPKCEQAVELNLALSAKIIRMLTGGRSKPLQVLVPHSPINTGQVYRKAFPCEVVFNQGIAGYWLNASDLMLPLIAEQSELGEMAYSYLQNQFMAKRSSITEQVRSLIKPLLMVGQCTNEVVASTLEMEVRQLHRMLEKEGTKFRYVKDEVLKELAEHYLKEKSLKLGQVGRLLGYAEQSAFSRSCQRWFGMGPRDYRKKQSFDAAPM